MRSRFGGQRSGYNTVQHESPIGAAFEHVPISENQALSTNLQSSARKGTHAELKQMNLLSNI